MQTTTIRPGWLVSLSTTVSGNVAYSRRDLEADRIDDNGAHVARWETERTIADLEEHETAIKTRGKCRSLIAAVCAQSRHGLLCPESDKGNLDAAVDEAQNLADAFNAGARLTRISINVIAGHVAQDDVQAVRAINSEIRGLLTDMQSGLQSLDAEAVRAAASKARSLGMMLSSYARTQVEVAVDAARQAARKIVKAGETAAVEIDRQTILMITEARTAFLDLDEATQISEPVANSRAIDLTPECEPASAPAAAAAVQIEF